MKNYNPKKHNWHPSDECIRDCDYEVPEEQLLRYRSLTPLQRLRWLDDARRLTLLARMSASARRRRSLIKKHR